MKTKNLSKKLTINKKTIANLISTEMNGVRGGYHITFSPWVTCDNCTFTCEICTYTCDITCY
jgi:natural product precursor